MDKEQTVSDDHPETLRTAIEATERHRLARTVECTARVDRDRAIVDAVRAGAVLVEIADVASITRAAASLAARRTLAARPGRGAPYSRRRGTAAALQTVSEAARDLAEAVQQSRETRNRRDAAIAAAVATGAGVSATARAIGMTPASVSVIARSPPPSEAIPVRHGAVASRQR